MLTLDNHNYYAIITALAFAKTVEENVLDEDTKKMSFFAIQQARMFANQGITVDELLTLQNN